MAAIVTTGEVNKREYDIDQARWAKAKRLLAICVEVGATADDVDQWEETNWQVACDLLNLRSGGNVKTPSPGTVTKIINLLRGRESRERRGIK